MSNKLDYLRKQAAAYLEDARSADSARAAAHLVMLAARCQEFVLQVERQAVTHG